MYMKLSYLVGQSHMLVPLVRAITSVYSHKRLCGCCPCMCRRVEHYVCGLRNLADIIVTLRNICKAACTRYCILGSCFLLCMQSEVFLKPTSFDWLCRAHLLEVATYQDAKACSTRLESGRAAGLCPVQIGRSCPVQIGRSCPVQIGRCFACADRQVFALCR